MHLSYLFYWGTFSSHFHLGFYFSILEYSPMFYAQMHAVLVGEAESFWTPRQASWFTIYSGLAYLCFHISSWFLALCQLFPHSTFHSSYWGKLIRVRSLLLENSFCGVFHTITPYWPFTSSKFIMSHTKEFSTPPCITQCQDMVLTLSRGCTTFYPFEDITLGTTHFITLPYMILMVQLVGEATGFCLFSLLSDLIHVMLHYSLLVSSFAQVTDDNLPTCLPHSSVISFNLAISLSQPPVTTGVDFSRSHFA